MEQAALLEEESEYSYVDSEYMSDEEMLMQEFPDNPTYAQVLQAVKSMNPKAKYKLAQLAILALLEAEAELEGEMDEDDFDDEQSEDINMKQLGRDRACSAIVSGRRDFFVS